MGSFVLMGNQFNGTISDDICQSLLFSHNKFNFDISYNDFSGTVPDCLWNISDSGSGGLMQPI